MLTDLTANVYADLGDNTDRCEPLGPVEPSHVVFRARGSGLFCGKLVPASLLWKLLPANLSESGKRRMK